jgi:transcriptional regulator with XRE-family HTH domain
MNATCIICTMVMHKRKTPASEKLSRAFGARIVQLRQKREWTQQQVSDQAGGLDRGFISRIESGQIEPCLGTLTTLAKAFGLTLSELLEGM